MAKGLGHTKFDPSKAIDPTSPPVRMFGSFGLFPSRPCDNCGHDMFYTLDWNMGYRCAECNTVFGSKEELDWYHGKRQN